jgi:hypothetical protein
MRFYPMYVTDYELEVIIKAFKDDIDEDTAEGIEQKRILNFLKLTAEMIKEDKNATTTSKY